MATIQSNFLEVSYLMSNTNPKTRRQKLATIRYNVPEVVVNNYLSAADDAARAATAAGLLIAAVDNLTLGVRKKVSVGAAFTDSAAVPPAVDVFAFPFDKFGVAYVASGDNFVSSIPARDDTAVNVGPDGVSVLITDPEWSAATEAFIGAFENIVLSEDNNAATITQITIPS
jgi:hypothetical protein